MKAQVKPGDLVKVKPGDLVKIKTAILESALHDYWGLCIVQKIPKNKGPIRNQLYASVWSITQNRSVQITVDNLVLVEQ